MRKLIPTALFLVGLIILINVVSPEPIRAQVINKILKRMEDRYQKLHALRASIRMDRFYLQLGEHEISDGRVIFIPQKGRDAALRIDWVKPARESLSVVNKQYAIYRPNIQTVYTGSLNTVDRGKNVGPFAFLNMSKAELKANFEMNYLGIEKISKDTKTWHLMFVPKNKSGYKNADIWVDKKGMPIQIKQSENNKDTTTILLSGLKKNTKIDAKVLVISLPKGTRVIKG